MPMPPNRSTVLDTNDCHMITMAKLTVCHRCGAVAHSDALTLDLSRGPSRVRCGRVVLCGDCASGWAYFIEEVRQEARP